MSSSTRNRRYNASVKGKAREKRREQAEARRAYHRVFNRRYLRESQLTQDQDKGDDNVNTNAD